MIPNKEGYHYIEVKMLLALSRGITLKHNGDYYCLNCFHLFRTKNKLKSYIKLCANKVLRNVVMPYKDTKIL